MNVEIGVWGCLRFSLSDPYLEGIEHLTGFEQVVTAWNGLAICAFATASRVLAAEDPPPKRDFPAEARPPSDYLEAAEKVPRLRTHVNSQCCEF